MSDEDEIQRIFAWHQRVQFRKTAGPIEREAWIATARQIFDPGEREECWVCGKFKSIAQAHHVIPLNLQYDRGFAVPDDEFVWLCPNHHAIAHAFIVHDNRSFKPADFRRRDRRRAPIHRDISETELEKIFDLMQRAGRSPR